MHATERKLYRLLNGRYYSKVKRRLLDPEEDVDINLELIGERRLWKAAICAGLLDYLQFKKEQKLYNKRIGLNFNARKDYRFKESFLTSWLENKAPTAQNPRPLSWMLDLIFENSEEMHAKIIAKIKKVAEK